MLQQPTNTKFRKDQKQSKQTKGLKSNSNQLNFGLYGIKTLQGGHLRAGHIEGVRRVIIRRVRRIGKIWIRVFPYKPISSKPIKTRMGKGKGSVQFWVCPIKKGQILFEISGSFTSDDAKSVLSLASQKLPVLTKIVSWNDV